MRGCSEIPSMQSVADWRLIGFGIVTERLRQAAARGEEFPNKEGPRLTPAAARGTVLS